MPLTIHSFIIMKAMSHCLTAVALALLLAACGKRATSGNTLLNASYDPTREFYAEVNAAFAKQWQAAHGTTLNIEQSHGGSGKQARAVIDGLEADVVTLALAGDIDEIVRQSHLLPGDWQAKLPNHSAPYTSTIVLVVRKGNPKGIKDWGDLVKDGVKVITPNPKTSGGARWNYLAAWAWAAKQFGGDQAQILAYMTRLFKNVPVLGTGARDSTSTFAQQGNGDVLLAWENEAYLIAREFPGLTDVIYPSLSILAEPPVAVVEANAARHGTTAAAQAYLEFLYTDEGQALAAKNFYRPRKAEIAAQAAQRLPELPMVSVDADFGGWAKAQATHFDDGGTFDQVQGFKH